jgi:hypothetical protein
MTTGYQVVGPHAQTLFLGCSVTEASMTLAWGSESSTCDVKLVNDYVAHHRAAPYGPLNTALDSIHSTIDNTTPSSTIAANARAQQYLKPIVNYEKKKKDINLNQDGAASVPLAVRDLGKKCWDPHNPGGQPFHWLGSDPGFLGINYYIVGCPCKFRFENLSFTGFVNKWTYDNNIFNVTMTGPGSLLKGCRLIINEYYGTISSLMPFSSDNNNPIAVPYSNPSFNGAFNAQIAHGNIPNLFNIYGWLQNQFMGFAKVNDTGVSAAQIYDVLLILLGGGEYSDFVDADGNAVEINSEGITCNKFSPFGGIVSKSPLGTVAGGAEELINTSNTNVASSVGDLMELTKMGLLRTVPSIDNRQRCIFKLDLSNVPRPDPNLFLPLQSHIGLDEFIDFCCRGVGRDWNCELVPEIGNSAYTGRIVINTYDRKIQYKPRVIRDFITNFSAIDNVISYDVGEEFKADQPVRKVVIGGPQERVAQLMTNTVSKYNGSLYHVGSNVFTPRESWIVTSNLNNGSPHNIYREPLADVQRVWDTSQSLYRMINGGVTAQSPSVASEDLYPTNMHNSSVIVGSYYTNQPDLANIADPFINFYNSAVGLVGAGLAAYPVHLDLISQYFGVGSDGYPRRVFYDRRLKQLKVNVPISDILSITSVRTDLAQDGYITIWENEIRAALAGVWLQYITSLANVNIWTPTARLLASYATSDNNAVIQEQVLAAAGIIPFHGSLRWSIAQGWGIFGPGMSRTFTRVMEPIIEGLAEFIKTELGSHYGKSYLLRMPNVQRSEGFDGKIRYDYEITDSGWEEQGNMIDDTIVIGVTPAADLLSEDNGKFGPILGWHSSAEMAIGNPIYNNQGPLSNLSSKALSKSTDVYYTLVADGDSVIVAYAPVTYKGTSTSQPSFSDAFNRPVPQASLFKTYKKVAMGQINKNPMFYDDFLKIQYALITSNSMVSTEANIDMGRVLASDYYLATRVGQETATYSAAPDLRYQQIQFMNQAVNRFDPGGVLVMSDLMFFGSYSQFYPRAVAPCFAAVPVKYNRYCYGPWSSSPGEIANLIFPETNSLEFVNNIVGGVELDINSQYVPWEYGGMDALDTAVLTELGNSNEYQQIEETGRITLAGIMLNDTAIGKRIVYDGRYGPLCNSISLNFGNDGTRTTYFFRTFSRKLGYFNKENADNIKNNSKKNMELRSQIAKNLKG